MILKRRQKRIHMIEKTQNFVEAGSLEQALSSRKMSLRVFHSKSLKYLPKLGFHFRLSPAKFSSVKIRNTD